MKSEELAIHGGPPVRPGEKIPLTRVCWDEREEQAIQRVFKSGIFCAAFEEAREVRALEAEFARQVGARHAVAFSSGTTAQHAALLALGIGPGDEVIVPPLTFISTAYTVLLCGALPVFADVCRDTINIDPQDIEKKITPRTRAIGPVHWLGHPADMEAIMGIAAARGLAIVEDCAHAPGISLNGKPVGSFGQVACWSLQQTKLITAAGEGGLATTDDEALATRLRQCGDHGKDKALRAPSELIAPYQVTALGNNYRLSEMQAAFARAQLGKLEDFIEQRRTLSATLREKLEEIPGLEFQVCRPGVEQSCCYFPVLFPRESFAASVAEISAAMHAEGVVTHPMGLDELCHVHPLFADAEKRAAIPAFSTSPAGSIPAYGWGTLPVAEKIAGELLLLPMYPDLSEGDLDDVVRATFKVAGAYRQ